MGTSVVEPSRLVLRGIQGMFEDYRKRSKGGSENGHDLQESRIWWIQFYQGGKAFRESSGSRKKIAAQDLLREGGKVAEGASVGLKPEKTRFDELGLISSILA
jgi:hypothetical protein